nr:Protein F22D3.2, isoform b [Haemonchus contortus]
MFRCNACTSFGNINQPCLLSNDHENKTSYISTQIPLKERVYERSMAAATFENEMSQDDAMRPQYASMAGRLPTGWFRPTDKTGRRMAIDTKRNLQTITGDELIWNRLHSCHFFMFIPNRANRKTEF